MDQEDCVSELGTSTELAGGLSAVQLRSMCDTCEAPAEYLTKQGLSLCKGCLMYDDVKMIYDVDEKAIEAIETAQDAMDSDFEDEGKAAKAKDSDSETDPDATGDIRNIRLKITRVPGGKRAIEPKLVGGSKAPSKTKRRTKGPMTNATKKANGFIANAVAENWDPAIIKAGAITYLGYSDHELSHTIHDLEGMTTTEKTPEIQQHLILLKTEMPERYADFQMFKTLPYLEKREIINNTKLRVSRLQDELLLLENEVEVLEHFIGNSAEKVVRQNLIALLREEFEKRSKSRSLFTVV